MAEAEAAAERARREAAELAERVDELERAAVEAAGSSGALSAEQRTVKRLREELSALRAELGIAKRAAAERPDPEEVEHERVRAAEAEAAAGQARQEALELADRVAELEQAAVVASESSGALSAEQRTVKKLRDELSALRAELKAAKRAVAEQSGAEAGRQLAAAAAAAEAERETIEALRTELSAAHAELAQWQSQAADLPAEEPATSSVAATQPAPGAPTWSLTAQRAFSAELVSISDWRAALKQAVKVVGVEGIWDAVVVWSPEQRRKDMKCAAMWSNEALSATTFETRVWQHRHKLPADARSEAATAPLAGAGDRLLKAAAEAGMNSSVLVPIGDGPSCSGCSSCSAATWAAERRSWSSRSRRSGCSSRAPAVCWSPRARPIGASAGSRSPTGSSPAQARSPPPTRARRAVDGRGETAPARREIPGNSLASCCHARAFSSVEKTPRSFESALSP